MQGKSADGCIGWNEQGIAVTEGAGNAEALPLHDPGGRCNDRSSYASSHRILIFSSTASASFWFNFSTRPLLETVCMILLGVS